MKTAMLIALLIVASPALADTPNNYTLLWKETVKGDPRVHMARGFTKQSCEDAAAKLAQMSAFCEPTPNEMPVVKSDKQEPAQ